MEGVVAAQVQEARVPVDTSLLAPGDDRAQVVVDALARHTAEPVEEPHVALQERLGGHVEARSAPTARPSRAASPSSA